MAEFQVVVGDPETGDSYQFAVDGADANRFLGKELGEEVDGGAVGLDGYTLQLSGGSDAAGRPLRPDVAGPALKEILVAERSTGYKPGRGGERRRITVRGREITDEVAQINARITERGSQSVEELLAGDGAEDAKDAEGDEAGAEDE